MDEARYRFFVAVSLIRPFKLSYLGSFILCRQFSSYLDSCQAFTASTPVCRRSGTAPTRPRYTLTPSTRNKSFNTWGQIEIGSTRTLNSQVGGYAGVLTTEDGSLLIKAALPPEREIYQKLLYDPALEALRPFTVNFLGTLKLKGEVDQSNPITANGVIAIKPIDEHKDEFLSRNYNASDSTL